jgi:hypothetical protein
MTYTAKPINTPWGGWVDSMPAMVSPSNSFKQITGFMINKGRLQSHFKKNTFVGPPNGQAIQGARSFIDVLGNYHTIILTRSQAYYLNNTNVYTPVGAAFNPQSNNPFAIQTLLNKAWFANGGQKLSYVAGDDSLTVAGDVPGTCQFLGKLGNRLIQAYLQEPETGVGSTPYPSSVRWCANGNPTSWLAVGAGQNVIADIEDQITGITTLGSTGYVFRSAGITAMSTTGNSAAPFRFENFSIGESGIGCGNPYTLATYGNFCVFCGLDDIYYFDGGAPRRIGGNCKKTLMRDIYNRSNSLTAFISGSAGNGVDFLAYWLLIPSSSDTTTKVWVYHFDTGTWHQDLMPFGKATMMANLAIS